MDPIGKSPIATLVLISGKLAMVGCWLFLLVKDNDIAAMAYDGPVTRVIGLMLFAAGIALITLSFIFLGKSVSVGLPESETELKTRGVYRISRNPMYLAVYLMCAGSCCIAIHPLNLFLFAVTVAVHHRIILKEELFLEARFGRRYVDYKSRVPRYFGWTSSMARRNENT
ncbi:MAG TPA: isoprenylcysteine carboxylmethyltransferase family protein [Bacteroidota bacterium]|nr:isoprenylcysteine carboxylmethyltransferase family protein [Bacteroidota bacterium]